MAPAALKENQPLTTSMNRHEPNRLLGAAMLMSPPPEETLRYAHAPAAKRTVSTPFLTLRTVSSSSIFSALLTFTAPLQPTNSSIGPLAELLTTNRSPVQLSRKRGRPPEALSQASLSTSEKMVPPSNGTKQTLQYTPNPRVRKQTRREDNIMVSSSIMCV